MQKISAIIELSRWKEHVPFVVPLTLMGSLIAVSGSEILDQRLLYVILGNIITVTYAFMINDIEDAEDDARDKDRKRRNPVASGKLSETEAYTIIRVMASLAIILYCLTNALTLGLGIMTLLLSHLYSWKRIRLKAYPVADIVSHSLMLSGLLVATGFTTYGGGFGQIWIIAAAATLFSVYGQIYNQLRDYELDKLAKLKNTTILLGVKRAKLLKNASIFLSVIAAITAVYFKTFPFWLAIPIVLWTPVVFSYRIDRDMRGVASIDVSGSVQLQLMLLFNIAMLSWLSYIFILQLI